MNNKSHEGGSNGLNQGCPTVDLEAYEQQVPALRDTIKEFSGSLQKLKSMDKMDNTSRKYINKKIVCELSTLSVDSFQDTKMDNSN